MTKRAEQAMRRQLMKQIDPGRGAGELVDALLCSVCSVIVGPGGRKGEPALCPRCYQRERRNVPAAPRTDSPRRSEKLTVQFTSRGRVLLEQRAARAGVSISVYLEGLVMGAA